MHQLEGGVDMSSCIKNQFLILLNQSTLFTFNGKLISNFNVQLHHRFSILLPLKIRIMTIGFLFFMIKLELMPLKTIKFLQAILSKNFYDARCFGLSLINNLRHLVLKALMDYFFIRQIHFLFMPCQMQIVQATKTIIPLQVPKLFILVVIQFLGHPRNNV
ncbi:unnamed protein product, partial [Vitis vinifera]